MLRADFFNGDGAEHDVGGARTPSMSPIFGEPYAQLRNAGLACTSASRICANHFDDGVENRVPQRVRSEITSEASAGVLANRLAKANPIVYTTHSPFLVDSDHADRVRVVYVDSAGATTVSADLRANTGGVAEARSVYAVHAALGLSVSDAMLQGCTSVVVEGTSDQFYLTGIKTVLIARKKWTPLRELLFVPAGGARGVNTIVPIITAKDEELPIVLLDDDRQGRQFAASLRDGAIYKGNAQRILNVREFTAIEFAEIEDLLPAQVSDAASRMFRGRDDDFKDVFVETSPIVPQIEAYAERNALPLEVGWKVDLARQVKQRLLRDMDRLSDDVLNSWAALFARFAAQAK